MGTQIFNNRRLVIATKHGKELVIAPLLEQALGVTCFINTALDTDLLGTFTGEIARTLDPMAAARKKCMLAMELNNCDLAIASEGSFGPHPTAYFINANEELLLLVDTKNKLEILVRHLSTKTNFNGKEVTNERELLEFAQKALFPTHALILRSSQSPTATIIKDIKELRTLKESFAILNDAGTSVFVETDMRAMNNPSRMAVIKETTVKLVNNIASCCPQCSMPGFSITEALSGLPCDLCGNPTQSTRSYVYTCTHCDYSKETLFPHKKNTEDPRFCDYCNP